MADPTQKAQKQRKRARPPVTGLRIDRQLVRSAKYLALDRETTLTDVVNKAIEAYIRTKVS